MADKIIEFVSTGTIRELDEMRAKMPVGLLGVMDIPGLGPKTVALRTPRISCMACSAVVT